MAARSRGTQGPCRGSCGRRELPSEDLLELVSGLRFRNLDVDPVDKPVIIQSRCVNDHPLLRENPRDILEHDAVQSPETPNQLPVEIQKHHVEVLSVWESHARVRLSRFRLHGERARVVPKLRPSQVDLDTAVAPDIAVVKLVLVTHAVSASRLDRLARDLEVGKAHEIEGRELGEERNHTGRRRRDPGLRGQQLPAGSADVPPVEPPAARTWQAMESTPARQSPCHPQAGVLLPPRGPDGRAPRRRRRSRPQRPSRQSTASRPLAAGRAGR